ncbi:hypothetical protein DL96DRAFT_1715624 [Flagelloscypha sp. PMI_526]|nr:hypothetical protein DL96DRAFT_1715624 [Flagelloscypha sp. PMI_526]
MSLDLEVHDFDDLFTLSLSPLTPIATNTTSLKLSLDIATKAGSRISTMPPHYLSHIHSQAVHAISLLHYEVHVATEKLEVLKANLSGAQDAMKMLMAYSIMPIRSPEAPPEIWDMIWRFSACQTGEQAKILSLVSRSAQADADEYLYHTLPGLSSYHLRQLLLQLECPHSIRLRKLSWNVIEAGNLNDEWDWPLLVDTLNAFPNLRTLIFDAAGRVEFPWRRVDTQDLTSLDKLRHFHLARNYDITLGIGNEELSPLRNLTHLSIRITSRMYSLTHPSPSNMPDYRGLSTLRRLEYLMITSDREESSIQLISTMAVVRDRIVPFLPPSLRVFIWYLTQRKLFLDHRILPLFDGSIDRRLVVITSRCILNELDFPFIHNRWRMWKEAFDSDVWNECHDIIEARNRVEEA